jgi:myosin heavy subunit
LHALIGPPSKGKSVHYEVGKLPELPPGASLVVNPVAPVAPVAAGSESKEGKQEGKQEGGEAGGEAGGDGEVGYAVGNSKIYFNVGVLERLEKRRETRVQELVIRAQRILRGALGRWHFAMFKQALTCLQSSARAVIQRKRFLKGKTGAMAMQARWRGVRGRRVARRRLENVTATLLQSRFRLHVVQRHFHRQKNAALLVQTFTRGRLQKRRYAVQLGEAREQAKMENQLQALQDRLAEEQRKQAVAMEEQRVAMEAAIAQARAEGAASPAKPTGGAGGETGGETGGMGGGNAEEGDSLTAATAHMLETMKGDNAKLRHDNERLTAENEELKVRLDKHCLLTGLLILNGRPSNHIVLPLRVQEYTRLTPSI